MFFKFKKEVLKEQIKEALDGLRALPAKIDVIRTYEVGENMVDSPRAWDAVLIGVYDDLEALDVYAKHPEHVTAAGRFKDICEAVGSVDYEV